MKSLAISEIAAAVSGKAGFGGQVTDICTDTRTLTKDCLFVCVEGENFDGHSFAETALEKGARAVLCHKDTGCENQILVEDTRTALLTLAGYYRRLFPIPVAGVTGSVGKTTIKEMTHAVFSAKFKTLKTRGNLNNEIGLPLTLFQMDTDTEAAVIEMGMSALGEISRLSKAAAPTMGIISNIGVSHLEKLGSRENILKAKLELTDGMGDEAPLILNGDDKRLYNAKIQRPIYYYGINNKFCRFKAYDIESDETGSRFTLDFGCGEQRISLPVIGKHNIYNALAAFSAGFLISVEPEAAAAALRAYEPEGMRQRIRTMAEITFVEDCYNASPDSMKAALSALKELRAKRRIAVLGDMLELGETSLEGHRQTGIWAARFGVDAVLTIGEQSLKTAEAARGSGVKTVESFDGKDALAKRLLELMEPGDAVLFKASRGIKLEEILTVIYKELKV
ncbi:MAG: UDP-N-acetylmuramoyl-tripeptide--D-alanyl-D-alanine ligase [Oscillospiraceae bacterium]|nr:UDP-N-acetylmuramoyl-tripeptide--D-alanyl-D-alanine ligase [Oscillospiraceae bacterium]